MSFETVLRQLAQPYYIVNIFLSLSYLIAKKLPFLCDYTFSTSDTRCELDSKDSSTLLFLMTMIMIRERRTGCSLTSYLSSSFIYAKFGNMVLWFSEDVTLGLVFLVACVWSRFCLPEPTYFGPENVTYFRGLQALDSKLKQDQNVSWLIAFVSTSHPACHYFNLTFAKLSAEYHCDYLRFGKIDIGEFPDAGKKYHVSDSFASQQLPSLILFQNGKEINRRPNADSGRRLQKFDFFEDNIRVTFDLKNLYEQSKRKTESKMQTGTSSSKKTR